VSRFDSDLREGLEVVLGTPVPALADESFLFFEQWLAERNLGLVPVANARNFEWATLAPPANGSTSTSGWSAFACNNAAT
jgi:hypothetical protein